MEHDLQETARLAARAGAQAIAQRWGGRLDIRTKSAHDYVTDVDRAAQDAVLAVIRQRHPDHRIMAEEDDQDWRQLTDTPGHLWVVDPLDGTTNFIHGFPHVAVSVAVLADGRPLAGVVRDVTKDEEFGAAAGQGAWLNGQALSVRPLPRDQALLGTGFPFREHQRLDAYLELFKEIFREISGVRRAGAAALDLAYVAAGRLQGFWELGLKPWDVAAGILLITEAGGLVDDFSGGGNPLWRGDVVCAEPGIFPWLAEVCGRHFPRG